MSVSLAALKEAAGKANAQIVILGIPWLKKRIRILLPATAENQDRPEGGSPHKVQMCRPSSWTKD